MESQLGSFGLGPGDNKGILSLLTAIEQSEDHFDTGQQALNLRMTNQNVWQKNLFGHFSRFEPSFGN
jgi:hypothetical protein